MSEGGVRLLRHTTVNDKQRLATTKTLRDRVRTACAEYIVASRHFQTLMAAVPSDAPPADPLQLQQGWRGLRKGSSAVHESFR